MIEKSETDNVGDIDTLRGRGDGKFYGFVHCWYFYSGLLLEWIEDKGLRIEDR